MTIKIGDTIVSVTEEKDLRNYQGHRVLGLSCITKDGKKGYIKLLADLTLPEFWRYVSGETAGSVCSVQKKIVMKILGLSREALETIIDTPEKAKKFLFLHEVSHILHEDSNNRRLSEVPHLHPYRIGIEARATWDAWTKIRNNNYNMAKYRVQRVFSEDGEQKSGMGTGTKIALGVGAIGAGLMAGRAGMLGSTVQKGIGTGTAWVGKTVGSQGIINDGAKTVGKAAKSAKLSELGGASALKESGKFTEGARQAITAGKEAEKGILNTYKLPTQAAFSEDTKKSIKEAALIGTGLTLTAGGILAAKKGWLGFTENQRKASKKAIEKVGKIWNEVKSEGSTGASSVKKWLDNDFKKLTDAEKSKKFKGKTREQIAEALGIKPNPEWVAQQKK